ncbi:dual specificity protein phosphatase 3-like [Oratosquilla oratoria]|uniref:dual specificity protein phosphatase 3-like n=1 Tax=Oratosquilla oratoria TaxID=337810 RepID=UPI003F76EBE4
MRKVQRSRTSDMRDLLFTNGRWVPPADPYNEVYPGILIGDVGTALSTIHLRELGVTHVLNAAHGRDNDVFVGYVNTGPSYYERAGITFKGIHALDLPFFSLRPYFEESADFIEQALRARGKVLVHCQCGISRSVTLVLAFLMLKRSMTLPEALSLVSSRRSVFPNQGFLRQLCDFEYGLLCMRRIRNQESVR